MSGCRVCGKEYDQIIGIDPGLTGAIAVLRRDGDEMVFHDAMSMPKENRTVSSGGKAKKRGFLDTKRLHDLLSNLVSEYPSTLVGIEAIASMGRGEKLSTMAAFGFGRVIGSTETVVTFLGVDNSRVAPATWKRYLGLNGSKAKAKELATEIFGDHFKGRADYAEAALIGMVAYLDAANGISGEGRAKLIYEEVHENGPIGSRELRAKFDWAKKDSAWNNAVARYKNMPGACSEAIRGYKDAQFWIRGVQPKPAKKLTTPFERVKKVRSILRSEARPMSAQEIKDAVGEDWVNSPNLWGRVTKLLNAATDITTQRGHRTIIYKMEN